MTVQRMYNIHCLLQQKAQKLTFLQKPISYSLHFAPFLKPRHGVYNARKSPADGVFLEVPHFATSVFMSTKHFDLSFAYDTPKIWNGLPDVHSATSPLIQKEAQNLSLRTSIYTLTSSFLVSLCGTDPAMSHVND